MKCSVFIATSADGYIATRRGGVDWLEKAGRADANMGECKDMGFRDYLSSVDCMVMGRKCMEKISSFNLTSEQWPYADIPIFVLSNTLKVPPENMKGRVALFSGEIEMLITRLEKEGFKHAYIDGGTTITSFLNHELIDEMTITQAPVLLGDGIPLFGKTNGLVSLENCQVKAYPNDFMQVKYRVKYL